MKKLFLLAVIASIYANGISQCAASENIYMFEYGQKSYELVMEKQKWEPAAACAVERGGYLVEITDVDEQNAVFDAILNGAGVSPTYVEVGNGGNIAYVWIGASDIKEEGTWLWDGDNNGEGTHFWSGQGANGENDGEVIEDAYVNWGGTGTGTAMEPDNYGGAGQDNAAIGLTGWPSGSTALGSPGEWNDIISSSSIYYVIEYDTIVGSPTSNFIRNEEPGIRIYPNPSQGILNVHAESIRKLEIFDITGQLQGAFFESPMDISYLYVGAYILKVHTLNGTYTERFFRK